MIARRLARAVPLVAVAALFFPSASVQPTTVSLVRVENARSVDVGDGVIWVLVLGYDAERDTDAIQLIGIDPERGSAAGIGIPRDSYVAIPGEDSPDRINTAWAKESPQVAAQTVQGLVGIAPDYVLVVGFEGFLATAGVLGDVEVQSDQRFLSDEGMLVRRGTNTFDAAEALEFAQSRENLIGNDFARSANHQALLLGFLRGAREREDEEGFMERIGLAALRGLDTDAAPTDLYRLAQAVTQVHPDRVTGCIVPGTPAERFGASVVLPDEEIAQRLGEDAREDATLEPGCTG